MGFAASLIPAGVSLVGGLLKKGSQNKEAGAIERAGAAANAQIQPFADSGVAANETISNVLAGGTGSDEAFKQFQNSTGFRSQIREGQNAITGSAAARGLLNSGSTLKALNQFGRDQAQKSFGSFLDIATKQADRGANAAARVASNTNTTGVNAAGARSAGDDALQSGIGAATERIIPAIFGG